MLRKTIIIMFLISLFCFPLLSFAYETIKVENGGSIEGTVEFTGATVPEDETLTLSSETEYCGKTLPAEKYVIKDRKIGNVVVFIKEIKAGKAIPQKAVTITNSKCVFVPHVAVAFKGNTFTAKNDDPVFHTFHLETSMEGKPLFSIGLHEKGSTVKKSLTKAGIIEVTCYVHPWQLAFVYVFDHPYAAVTNGKGEFVIKDVPAGVYTIGAWHEALGKVETADVKVEDGKPSTIKLTYTGK